MNSGAIQKNNAISVESKEHFSSGLIVNDLEKLTSELKESVDLGVEYIVMSIIEDPVNEIK